MTNESNQKRPPKRKSAKYKANIVLEVLRGGIIDEIARREGVAVHELEKWREVFLKDGENGFKKHPSQSRLKDAQRVIGDLTMENELLKKKLEIKRRNQGK